MVEKVGGVGGVVAAENDGGGGHGGSGLGSKVGSRVVDVNLVSSSGGGHVLWSLPAVVVRVSISHLRT